MRGEDPARIKKIKSSTSCPNRGEGGGGEVIWAMPERKHFFLWRCSLTFIFLDDGGEDKDGMERRVLAMSLEEEEEEVLPPAGEEEEEEEMLKMAIAMSLEQEEQEKPSSVKGELLRMQNRQRWKFDKSFTGAAETEMVARKNSAASDQVSLKC